MQNIIRKNTVSIAL